MAENLEFLPLKPPNELPDALGRRKELYGPDTPPERLKAYGDLYKGAERLLDALEFYVRGSCAEELKVLLKEVQREGDAFMLHRYEQLTGEKLDTAIWEDVARNAQSRGQLAFARLAFERAGLEEEAKAIAEQPDTATAG